MKNVKAFLLAASLITVMTFSGCETTNDSVHTHDTVTYSYQDADAVIEDIDMRYWFATCPRWQWDITVSYDGLTYTDTGWAYELSVIRRCRAGRYSLRRNHNEI